MPSKVQVRWIEEAEARQVLLVDRELKPSAGASGIKALAVFVTAFAGRLPFFLRTNAEAC